MLKSFLPVVTVTKLARSLLHFVFAPGHFFFRKRDQFFRRVGNHFVLQFTDERVAPNRVADDVAGVAGTRGYARSRWPLALPGPASRRIVPGACALSSQTHYAFTEKGAVTGQGLVERFVRFFVPPGEDRIISIVERVPIAQIAAQRVDRIHGAKRNSLLD